MNPGRLVLINVVIIVVLLAIGAGGVYYYNQSQNYVGTNNAQVTGNTVTLLAMTTGKVTSVNVTPGQQVRKNQAVVALSAAGKASSAAATKPTATGRAPKSTTSTAPKTVTPPASAATATKVASTVSGRVATVLVSPGEFVTAGEAVATVVQSGDTWITANISENQIGSVHAGQTVDVTIDAFPGTTFNGTVEYVEPATQANFSLLPPMTASGTYTRVTQLVPVAISLDSSGYRLMSGESAEIRIHIH